MLAANSSAQNYSQDRYVIASGGGALSSTNYSGSAIVEQTVVGESSSLNYVVGSGFWYGLGGTGGGCDYVAGNVNGSCSYKGLNITYGMNYFKGGSGPIPCGDCRPLVTVTAIQKRRGITKAE